jgi:hypothetical protein
MRLQDRILSCLLGFANSLPLLIIWPFFHAVGVMLDFAVNIGEVELLSTAFPWAVGAKGLMPASGALLTWLALRRARQVPEKARFALLNRS